MPPKKAKKVNDPDDLKSFNVQEREILEKLRSQFLDLLKQNEEYKNNRYEVKSTKLNNQESFENQDGWYKS